MAVQKKFTLLYCNIFSSSSDESKVFICAWKGLTGLSGHQLEKD